MIPQNIDLGYNKSNMLYHNNKGQALILTTIFMLLILASSGVLISWSNRTTDNSRFLDRKILTKEIAKAGISKALFCLNGDTEVSDDCGGIYGAEYSGENNIQFGEGVFTTIITDIDSRTKEITSTGYYPNNTNAKAQTTIRTRLEINTDNISFNFGMQVGNGGFVMENNAVIIGNVYSNGNIIGSNGATISGDTWASGTSTSITSVDIGTDAHADIINDCDIDGDAYYNTISNSEIEGTSYTPYPNPEPAEYPISNELLDEWKLEANDGDPITGDLVLDGGETIYLGPKKIIGNLVLENNSTLVLTGGIYVTGNITVESGGSIRLYPSYSGRSGFLIADGIIYMQNNGIISGAGENSYIMLVSLAIGGGNFDSAIELKNNADGAVFFAPNGLIYLHNRVSVTELVGYAVHLSPNAILEYDFGLMNTNFSSGPGGGWAISKGTWQEL